MKKISVKDISVLSKVFALVFCFGVVFSLSSIEVSASDLDALVGEEAVVDEGSEEEDNSSVIVDEDGNPAVNPFETTTGKEDTQALVDALQSTQGIRDDSIAKASIIAQPIVSFLNVLSAGLLIVLMAGIGVVTVTDLIFIGLPSTRSLLHPMYNQMVSGTAPAGGGMMPMGGGFGGFGRGYGGYGGMGMAGGMQQQAQPQSTSRQWVSDEAVACIGLAQPQMQAQQPMGGMGMGMGMGMQQMQPQQPLQGKSVIFAYLKKRTFFLIVFAFATVFLTSSIATGFGFKLFSFVQELATKYL